MRVVRNTLHFSIDWIRN